MGSERDIPLLHDVADQDAQPLPVLRVLPDLRAEERMSTTLDLLLDSRVLWQGMCDTDRDRAFRESFRRVRRHVWTHRQVDLRAAMRAPQWEGYG